MCGIIGYTGKQNSVGHLINGLRALEYRGYDSAGIAYFDVDGKICCEKSAGRLSVLEGKLPKGLFSNSGIGHTRWATHGAPSDTNSHPHGTERVRLVHNGIIENYIALKDELYGLGYTFESETDTEAAVKLLDYYYTSERLSPEEAIRKTTARLVGSWAFGILFADRPDEIWAAKSSSPLLIGVADEGNFIASDITAVLNTTKNYVQLDDGDIALVTENGFTVWNGGVRREKTVQTALWDQRAAERGGYPHFMIKEINEEPTAVPSTLHGRVTNGLPDFKGDGFDTEIFSKISRVHIIACGTAMHAGLIAKEAFANYAKLPCDVEIASEFRYSPVFIDGNDLAIIISQSGETADSLAALRLAKERGAHTLAIVNVIGSTIAREADTVIYTMAGPEIAVASTKAYSVQTALMLLICIEAGLVRGAISEAEARDTIKELLERAPAAISETIAKQDMIKDFAKAIAGSDDLFFIGRGIDYHLACEGSLKLKEISYIHSEAYAAGELKHGTISLITDGTPVIAICTDPGLYGKTVSNIRETKARGAETFIICLDAFKDAEVSTDHVFRLPEISPRLAFLPAVTALQLLAYHTAVIRGCDVDKPRNLAKSVTVE